MSVRRDPVDRVPVNRDLNMGEFLVLNTGDTNSIGRIYETYEDGSADVQFWNTEDGEGSTNRDWRPSWLDVTQDLGEAFTHRPPTTSNGKCWNHVPRKEMVAVFDWQPRGDNQYFLPARIKRYIDGCTADYIGRGPKPSANCDDSGSR